MASVFVTPYSIMEKIQVTAFCIQEFIISGLYLWETKRLLQPGATFQKKRTRQVMLHLIIVNIVIILMDITLLCTEYADLYEIQITFKGTLYSIKLRLEFAVLNSLMSLTSAGNNSDEIQNHINSHSTTRNVGLETFRAPTQHGDDHTKETKPNSYSVFAARSHNSPFAGEMEENVVMKTTEVAVRTEALEPETEKSKIADHLKVSRHRSNPSPTSSEVEFAGEGF
jgi:hypothetical protein